MAGVTGQQRMLTPPRHLILPPHLSEARVALHSNCFLDYDYVLHIVNFAISYVVISHQKHYFDKYHSDPTHKYSEVQIKKMLVFLIDNIDIVVGGKVFQQSVGITMGTNCAPLLADLFWYSYEAEFIVKVL
jgi:hypothetical protein